jgi:hypothetical protein
MKIKLQDILKVAKKVYDRTLTPGQYKKTGEVEQLTFEEFDDEVHDKVDVRVKHENCNCSD